MSDQQAPDASNDAVFNREAVAVFHDVPALEAAIDELRIDGFSRAQISLLGDAKTIEEKLGDTDWKAASLEDSSDAPRGDYVSRESIGAAEGGITGALLYGGAIFAAIEFAAAPIVVTVVAATVAGTAAAALGGMLASYIGAGHAADLEEKLRHGGLLLWVRTFDEDQERRAVEILERCSGDDVHVHGKR